MPWARVFSASRSPSATRGWYVVYLFDAAGERAYLTLMQGTTDWVGETAQTRPLPELRARAQWARSAAEPILSTRPDVLRRIDLLGRSSKRAQGYEAGTVAALAYPREAIPSNDVLAADLVFLTEALGLVYAADATSEVADALTAAETTAGKRQGQGLRLSPEERLAIERHAVALTTTHLTTQGYTVVDVGATESYDLDARRGDEHLYVEVKGTTSAGLEVILTHNEVQLNAAKHPHTMLIVVHSITLGPTAATGGTLRAIHPWLADPAALTPISYRYRV
ncbi:MrcB family domain-containing protein [Actinokineospora sp. G85]|uniref:MrcB family domain-containing protein n=1 Tax=Actinokineospora sp. G85 TaxID=3406626 RepID=UPI003C707D4D